MTGDDVRCIGCPMMRLLCNVHLFRPVFIPSVRHAPQSQQGKKSLEVKKNRFDGDLGEVQLVFDPHSSRLRELN